MRKLIAGSCASALGRSRTSKRVPAMSALLPKGTFTGVSGHVRFVPKADSCGGKIAGRLKSLELKNKVMRKEVQEALESAIAGFEKRQQAEQDRLRERERFETDWARIRTCIVLPALEEVAAVLRKAGWLCEARAGDKDPGVHFTIYRGVKPGTGGGERPFMTYQPDKQQNAVLVNVATKGLAAPLGNFTLDKITEDFVQTAKFFARVASEAG
jgi:hypothetical protein